ncbi:TPA: hypothetical protein L3261_002229 [Elizabethkingia anophelis]|uniref:hypothetical protein n=1 Tax=Elizabethkingia anophelis TaxID=1117645 RepID=UPI00038A2DB5|nr:hypothetical protein [Elizabethkingia anophelis]EQB92716.1 hypothetical protein C874_18390 [Elizabethkingia anophelis 502]MCT3693598.1 hypothetical protein [Elizabethkingia anophelis]MCT3729026.1 hypothetical protein [Elizabethkingia anophelis]MCT3760557.1 hypothetical protein [Elizabethkingia anophelis]MCT3825068.1 hypothetical protein [Elizabethkingia anophelis]
MKKAIFLAILSTSVFSLNSCGVIFGGSKYSGTIKVKDHPNAEIYVDGNKIGLGEATKLFPRNKPLVVEVKESNCEPKHQTFDKTFRTGNFILSVFSWGILGAGIDLGTGAAYKPDHRDNPNIKKLSDKNYIFDINYSECKKP